MWEQIILDLQQLHTQGVLSAALVQRELDFIQQIQTFATLPKHTEQTSAAARIGADVFATGAFLPPTAPLSMQTDESEAPTVPFERLVPGQILCARYRVLALLAVGGMGHVYIVDDRRRKRHIAIKKVHPAFEHQELQEHLLQELALNELLTHPNIVRTYDLEYEEEGDFFFFTMEWVRGPNLAEWLSKHEVQTLSLQRRLSMLEQIARGLDCAHRHDVVHCDLKPANVLVTLKDEVPEAVKIVDFGIAMKGQQQRSAGIGTAYYMAPEQLRGEETSKHSDMYALSVLAFQLLTGHLPQPGIPGASVIAPDLPASIDPILTRAMHWKAQERFEKASEFVRALHEVCQPTTDPMSYKGRSSSTDSNVLLFPDPVELTHRFQSKQTTVGHTTLDSPQSSTSLVSLSRERDALFERLKKRIDAKRPHWIEHSLERRPLRSLEWTEQSTQNILSGAVFPQLPELSKGIQQRILLSKEGRPLLPFVYIPPSVFTMGCNASDDVRQKPERSIQLDGYWMARTPVTNRMWCVFLEESGYLPSARDRGTGYLRHWKNQQCPESLQHHPVVWLSFVHAWAFCDFYGLSLPSEAQWEKAARSEDARMYPWGDIEPTGQLCNFQNLQRGVSPVGQFQQGVSPFGVLDCSGNVFEWCSNTWDARLLENISADSELHRVPQKKTERVTVRGGHYQSKAEHIRTTFRQGVPLTQSAAHTSFRPVLDWKK